MCFRGVCFHFQTAATPPWHTAYCFHPDVFGQDRDLQIWPCFCDFDRTGQPGNTGTQDQDIGLFYAPHGVKVGQSLVSDFIT
jgi:hypothetical protein